MRIKFLFILILLIAITLPVNINARAAENSAPDFQQADIIPGELIVIMQKGKNVGALSLPEKARASNKKYNGLGKLNAGVINVPAGEENAYIIKLKKQKDVLIVEPNYKVSAMFTPDDIAYASQYSLPLIQAPAAWDITTGSSSVTIAIIDSGLDSTHPEFTRRTVAGYDFIDDDPTPQDDCGHGTHVTGIAAAKGNNAQGIAGIAWNVKIMPLRVLNSTCGGSFADIADALVWAADHGAQIVNLSLGGSSPSTLLENATYYAYTHGAAIFAAAGNSNSSAAFYPASYDWVMSIGATNSANNRWTSSNYGAALDLMAPGVSVYSTLPMQNGFFYNTLGYSNQYDSLSGTSMASPHAAGAAALLASMPGSCFDTPDKIYRALKDSAYDLGAAGLDNYYGYGLIQIADALTQCSPPISPPAPFAVEYDLVSSESCNSLAPYNWRDTSGGDAYILASESSYRNISLPPAFDFKFGGQSITSPINGHANGFISMGNINTSGSEGNYKNNFILPGSALPDNFIAPFWDDLTSSSTLVLYTQTFGSAPNREFVIEYKDFERFGVSGNLNFEVVLFETTNEILFQYKTLTGEGADGSSATVGLEYGSYPAPGLAGYPYSYNKTSALKSGLALLFIPYDSGSPELPSSVCPQMTRSKSIEAGGVSECATDPATFDVNIAQGALPYRSTLKIQQPVSAPPIPAPYLDLHHYADINLRYAPPAQTLSPMPEVYVCYEYTPQDVLTAGGHPENLFITAHSESTNEWSALQTSVDISESRLIALAPHFSYYGVATLNPKSNHKSELGLPVTGSPLSREFSIFLIFIGGVLIWLRKRAK